MPVMELPDILKGYGIDVANLALADHQRESDKTIFVLRVYVEQALARWTELRGLAAETGYWPIVGWDRFKRPSWEENRTRDIIAEANRLNVGEWFVGAGIAAVVDDAQKPGHAEYRELDFPPFEFHIHHHSYPFSGPSQVPIALIPTNNSWEAPAYLRGPDDGQPPHIHVAVLRYWHEHWGAEVLGWNSGTLELRVERPPTTDEDALELAAEQYVYCPDLVDQCMGSLSVLAKRLVNSRVWWFWWD